MNQPINCTHLCPIGSQRTPLNRLAHNTAVAALAWLPGGHTLAVGCQLRELHLYDLRATVPTGNPPSSTWAHSGAVNNIEVDPERPYLLATSSFNPGSSVKLWDSRKIVSSIGEIKSGSFLDSRHNPGAHPNEQLSTVPGTIPRSRAGATHGRRGPSGPVIRRIVWSSKQPGILSVAVGSRIHHYDTLSSQARPVLWGISDVDQQVADIAINPLTVRRPAVSMDVDSSEKVGPPLQTEQEHLPNLPIPQEETLPTLLRHRMLVVGTDGYVADVAKSTTAPLAVSRRDGSIMHALDNHIWVSNLDGAGE